MTYPFGTGETSQIASELSGILIYQVLFVDVPHSDLVDTATITQPFGTGCPVQMVREALLEVNSIKFDPPTTAGVVIGLKPAAHPVKISNIPTVINLLIVFLELFAGYRPTIVARDALFLGL